MPPARAEQLQLFDPAAPPSAGISPARLAVVRKAVFGNLTALKRATPEQVKAPAFAEWEQRFVELVEKLPEAERAAAIGAMRAAVESVR